MRIFTPASPVRPGGAAGGVGRHGPHRRPLDHADVPGHGLDAAAGPHVLDQLVARHPDARAAGQRGLQDLPGHASQRGVGLVRVPPRAEVDLREGVHAGQLRQVDQQPELDAVVRDERNLLQQVPPARVLTGQRLDEPGQLRPQRAQQGPGGQFGHPAAAGRHQSLGGGQRPVVEPLDVADRRVGQERAQQPHHELRIEGDQVRVDEDHQVAVGDVQRLPQRLTLAGDAAVLGQHVVDPHHPGTRHARRWPPSGRSSRCRPRPARPPARAAPRARGGSPRRSRRPCAPRSAPGARH